MNALITLARSIAALAFIAIAVTPALLVSAPVAADEDDGAQTIETYVSDDWSFSLAPYVWGLALKGDVAARGQESEVDIGFDEIFDHLNVAAMFQADARKGRFGVFVNPLYAALEDKQTVSGIGIEADIDIVITSFVGYYRLGPWDLDPTAGATAPKLVVDVYAGGRYTNLDLDLDVSGGPKLDGDQDWVDPIVGLQTLWSLSPRWTVAVMGDYGGFGVASDYQWQATGLLGYDFEDSDVRAYAGYRYLRQDYDTGSGSNKFEWDVKLHGPLIGLSWQF